MKKKTDKDWLGIMMHGSLFATILMFLLSEILPITDDGGFIYRLIVFTLVIFGGTGIYIILGVKLEEIRRKYGVKK